MNNKINLAGHISITSAPEVHKIVAPLTHVLNIKHFRYLKLYGDGSRILLSNYPDYTRFTYESDRYQAMWFDGEFPEYLKDGQYAWCSNKLNNTTNQATLEEEINNLMGLYHGVTFVSEGLNYFEIFCFDTVEPIIYHVEKKLFSRFMLYFKDQARKLIAQAENEKIFIPLKKNIFDFFENKKSSKSLEFLENTKMNRYYLSGKYSNIYLTAKEKKCVDWLIQGKTAEETAAIEGVHLKTVQCHLENIRKKLGCYKQTQLVRIILESGCYDAF